MSSLMKKITYADVGDNYDTKDPIKILAQNAAMQTGKNLTKHGFEERNDSRGESAYVWEQGDVYMATVTEQLGTKNLVADETRKITGKTYYDIIGHDTIATIVNDLVSCGAQPLVISAYWAIENNDWLADTERMNDLITGWKTACDLAEASWGGGETPTLKEILIPNTVALGGSAIGILKDKKKLISDTKLLAEDRILLLKSNGINANGLSLARAIAQKLPNGYATKMSKDIYGEAILTKTNIYSKLIQDLLQARINIHYISNITGHGFRKIMRARQEFTYVIEKLFEPQELFLFMQEQAGLTDYEMYDEFNMGMDYALFLSQDEIFKAQQIITKNNFESIDAGYVKKGERKVVIEPKEIIFESERLQVRL
jgi:phosphoribosylformylglycinamidine cyclo-ligase